MNPEQLAQIIGNCATREGVLDLLKAIERRAIRPPTALVRLRKFVEAWDDPIAIDDAVRDAIDAVDPVVVVGGTSARVLLAAMQVATSERASGLRRTKATTRRRAFHD